jgi:hypothetical protein
MVTRRTLLRWAAALVATWPLSSLRVLASGRPQAVALTADHTATLRAIADVVLPTSLSRDEQHAVVAQFVAWVANYREGAEMGHGYGTTRLRTTGPSPAATYPAQLAALEAAARAQGAASLTAQSAAGRRTIVEAALTTPQRVTQLPARPTGANVIADFMGMFFNGPEGYNLAYRAAINREDCRGLDGSADAPSPWPPPRRTKGAR